MIVRRTRTGMILTFALLLGLALGSVRGVAYAADGDLDTSFDGDGLVTTNFHNTLDEAHAVVIQPDGKIIAVGTTHISGNNNDFSVSRYNPNGSPDTTFGGGDGRLTTAISTAFPTLDDQAYSVALEPDGQIVVAGSSGPYNGSEYWFAVVRLNPDGSLDATFAGDGRTTVEFSAYAQVSVATGVTIQSDGKVVLAGYFTDTHSGTPTNFALARLNPDGLRDNTFGDGDGMLTTNFSGGVDEAHAVVMQEDKILVAGFAQVSGFNYDFALAQYELDGDLDVTFGGGDGKVTTDFFGGDDGALSMTLQPDGRIVAAGAFYSAGQGYDFGLARYLPNGDLDLSFDSDGLQAIDFVAGNATEVAFGVALQPGDGKIVAAGYAPVGGVNDFALVRLNPDGSLDASFGTGGRVNHDFGGGVALAYGVAVQADGRIVSAGTAYMGEPNSYDYALARYLSGDQAPTPTPTPSPIPTACPIQFPDVPPGSTFYDFVRCLACRGVVNGFPDGTFRPNNLVTRGQLSKIVSNAAGFTDPQPAQMFEDVPVGSTFQAYIGRLASRGYINGYPCGASGEPCVPPGNLPYFRPDNNATRGQIAKIDSNAAGYNDPPMGQTFEDVTPASTFYTFTQRLTSRSIMQGYPCGASGEPCVPPDNRPYFRPNNNATRGQTSKIVSGTYFPACETPGGMKK